MAAEQFFGGFPMAVVRARSAPPYALILFVVLWAISTVLAVLFYLGQTRAEEAKVDSDKAMASYVATGADRQFATDLLQQKPGSSVLGIAQDQINTLKKAIGA